MVQDASENTHLEVDESTPLIQGRVEPANIAIEDLVDGIAGAEETPPPMKQVAILCLGRLCETLSFFVILPFINQMIIDTGTVLTSDVGFWSGLIESLFSVVQMTLMIPYGRIADTYGRKPVLVMSLLCIGIATSLFGLAHNVWQMIAFRLLAGAGAGTVVTIRTMFSEVSTKKTEARVFSLFATASYMGMFFGPLLGGALSKPATNFPGLFGQSTFFKEYPYSLPTFVAGILAITASFLCLIFVKETLPVRHASHKPPPHQSVLGLLNQPAILSTLLVYTNIVLLGLAYTAVSPLSWFTPVSLSGFGFTPVQISTFMAVGGVSQSLWLLVVFPKLKGKLGTWGLLRLSAFFWPLVMVGNMVSNRLLRHEHTTAFWTLMPILLVIGSGNSMSLTGVQLAVNAVAPSSAVLGTLNGIALSMHSGVRALAPAAFSSLFAVGVRHQILGGYLALVVLTALSLVHTVSVWWHVLRPLRGSSRERAAGVEAFEENA